MSKRVKRVYFVKFRTKLILLLLILGYFLSVMIQQEMDLNDQLLKIDSLEQQISDVRHNNEAIRREIEHTRSKEYIEQTARDRLGWVKDGETIFIEKNTN